VRNVLISEKQLHGAAIRIIDSQLEIFIVAGRQRVLLDTRFERLASAGKHKIRIGLRDYVHLLKLVGGDDLQV
jgi:hypothetical protein